MIRVWDLVPTIGRLQGSRNEIPKTGIPGKLVTLPMSLSALHPHPDLPESLGTDYEEARRILPDSPRGAAALLRYIIDCLTIELHGAKGGSINDRIGGLVKTRAPRLKHNRHSIPFELSVTMQCIPSRSI
jgi:hypothetical protein